MVKLDLEINEIIGLAEMGKINENKLKKFLKAATKDELEQYIIENSIGNSDDGDSTETKETSDNDDNLDDDDDLDT